MTIQISRRVYLMQMDGWIGYGNEINIFKEDHQPRVIYSS